MYMQVRKYGLGTPILQLPGIMHVRMGSLLQYYYKQCYLSHNIIYEIVLNVYYDMHISIQIIYFAIIHACRILINRVWMLSWNIPLFEGHSMGASAEAYITVILYVKIMYAGRMVLHFLWVGSPNTIVNPICVLHNPL